MNMIKSLAQDGYAQGKYQNGMMINLY